VYLIPKVLLYLLGEEGGVRVRGSGGEGGWMRILEFKCIKRLARNR
jgi:hypothetical protein